MEIKRIEDKVKLVIELTKEELDHLALGFKLAPEDDDVDDCSCEKSSCYDCGGHKFYTQLKKYIQAESVLKYPRRTS